MRSILKVNIRKWVNLGCAVVQISAIFSRESSENAAFLFLISCEVSIHELFLLIYCTEVNLFSHLKAKSWVKSKLVQYDSVVNGKYWMPKLGIQESEINCPLNVFSSQPVRRASSVHLSVRQLSKRNHSLISKSTKASVGVSSITLRDLASKCYSS